MKTIKLIVILLVAVFVSNCSNKKPNTQESSNEASTVVVNENPVEASLFDRLGGTDGVSSIVNGIVQAHLENPVINHVFLPLKEDPEHFESFKTHVKEFLSAGTGGGATYTGKDLPSAHKGLNTTEEEFLSAVDDILMVLSKHNIDEETKKDMLYILYSMKGAVIGQ
ncbi:MULTISPECIES: group 1 truncated hemoglobin [Flavobacteriaceae]|uniref:Group 1 truncated hemoglobin n=2 Tax=Flavobacteriaceae TaxID=49546 RepID=A0A4Y8ANW8_9FLAO|nr:MULTISPECIES: group 1 truncated hemoglobin [Flavobacteriaceae]TEW72163.1 group 1 truncated hemoglobin [Gramella jeungdoensis]GGK56908.1 hypothetical protein GCM10007963_26390 [Lutibacter litoralis]